MPDITVLGSINIDFVLQCDKRPQPGETVLGSDYKIIPGGKGANQAFASSQLGAAVTMIGCVGDDTLSEIVTTSLQRGGVAISAIKKSSTKATGAAFITLDTEGDNTIVYSPSANNDATPDYIREHEALVRRSELIISNLEVPLESVEEFLVLSHAHGGKSLVNLAPCVPIGTDSPIWDAAILVVNELEAAYYTGIPITTIKDALKAAKRLLKAKSQLAIVTLGEEGSVAVSSGREYISSAVLTDVVDTTAAGDTYIGAFGVEWISSGDIQTAMDFSSCASALTVSRLGAQSSIPEEAEVRALLRKQ